MLRKRALSRPWGSAPWATPEAFIPLDSPSYLEAAGGVEVLLEAKLTTVRDFLARELKPDRKLVNAVLFQDGGILETSFTDPSSETAPDAAPEAAPAPSAAAPPSPTGRQKRPRAGATVAQPVRGCPAPDFSHAEIRAAEVLETFLTANQVDDFRTHNRFISVGYDTGHRYMLTSRRRRDQLKKFGGRSLFDLDERRAYCVHDWTVPASEELLALHLFLNLPGKEGYLRAIPEES